MIKGILNHRRKVHIVKCIYCEKQLQSKTNLLIHKISHEKKFKVNVANVTKILILKFTLKKKQ